MAVLLSSLAAEPLCGQCAYEVTAIVQPPPCGFTGPPPSTPWAINEAGTIAGWYPQCLTSDTEAFTWSASGGFVTLPRPADSQGAAAYDLNDIGWVVGGVESGNLCEAALWQGGNAILLGIPPGGNFSVASGVTESGVIVGRWGNTAIGPTHAFVWQDGVMTDLELPMGPNAVATDVNEAGAIVGWMGQATQIDARGFIYQDGTVTDLGVIPGGYTSQAAAVNQATEVVGSGRLIQDGEVAVHGFFWRTGEMTDVGPLPEFLWSGLGDINAAGQAVGRSWNAGGNPNISRAIIWQGGRTTDLNDLIAPDWGVSVWAAWRINDIGQITAQELGTSDTVLLTPIPVPGDIDGDCHTGVEDLMILIDAFGQSGSPADLNGDGVVNVLDLIILLLNFGS